MRRDHINLRSPHRRAAMALGSLGIIAALGLSACSNDNADSEDNAGQGEQKEGLSVVATTTQVGSITSQITDCAGGETQVLMGPGDDPHQFSLSSKQVTDVVDADLVVSVGLGLEAAMQDSLDNAESDGADIYEVGEELEPLPIGDDHVHNDGHDHDHGDEEHDHDHDHDHEHGHGDEEHGHDHDHDHGDEEHDHDHDHDHGDEEHDHDHDHDHGDEDPHVWMDVSRMATAAELIGDQLAEHTDDQELAEQYTSCASDVKADLEETDQEVRDILDEIETDEPSLVTDHAAYQYFADAYGFEIRGIVIPGGSTDAEPSSAALSELAQVLEDEDADAAVTDKLSPNPTLEGLAEDHGEVPLIHLYEGGLGEPDSEASTYQDAMIYNAEQLRDGLNGEQ
ncbi:metal ABC transporter substrate-binding protein [Auritidibacter ignavus]|uniref:Metal ABC transporter substrate-binding protein n=1 Tax=Auritidibacter ignavus TaxID=678932 RepID=A0AAJ6AII7_9MICC|nr:MULTISPECIES: metal ABC transporter substrate-binding protein [Auritidibacter]AXR73214.1 zinc ABC transporter substrate-binding protein [Auritidibacter sp. NML130574]WGH93352.1 metal ABC transporter substrate-binding protein [Auritidibacter ignavus]